MIIASEKEIAQEEYKKLLSNDPVFALHWSDTDDDFEQWFRDHWGD